MSRDASKWCLASASQDVASIIARNCRGISLRIRNWWVWKQPVHGFQRKFCERLIFFRLPSGQMQEKRGQAGGWFLILVLLPQVCFYLFNIVEFQELLHWVKILLLKSVFFKKKKSEIQGIKVTHLNSHWFPIPGCHLQCHHAHLWRVPSGLIS